MRLRIAGTGITLILSRLAAHAGHASGELVSRDTRWRRTHRCVGLGTFDDGVQLPGVVLWV